MDQDLAPVPVPPGYALVPVSTGQRTERRDWTYVVPVYDPGSTAERYWSATMKWFRAPAVAWLYLTWTWRRFATASGIAVLLVLVIAYG